MKRGGPLVRRTPLQPGQPLRRTPLTNTAPLLRSTRLRCVSRKRAGEQRTYSVLRREFLTARPVCEFPDCKSAPSEVHHRRGRVGALYLAVEHWSALCHDHHAYLTDHPAHAYELDLSERRNGRAA